MFFKEYKKYKKKEKILSPIVICIMWLFISYFNLIITVCMTILSYFVLYIVSTFDIHRKNKLFKETKEQLSGSSISYIHIDFYKNYISKSGTGYVIYYKINNMPFKLSACSKFIKFLNEECYLKPIYEDNEFIDFEIYLPKIF